MAAAVHGCYSCCCCAVHAALIEHHLAALSAGLIMYVQLLLAQLYYASTIHPTVMLFLQGDRLPASGVLCTARLEPCS
jgi:hypothetical protein